MICWRTAVAVIGIGLWLVQRRSLAAIPALGVLACVATSVACAPAGPTDDTNPTAQGSEAVALTVAHRSEWRALWIEGTTDLPDGAVVSYRVTHSVAITTPTEEWPSSNLIDVGRATVEDGQYWARINTLNWPPGEVRVVAQFPLPPQPPAVVDQYGEFGEHLRGANVTDQDGIKAVEVEHVFEHSR